VTTDFFSKKNIFLYTENKTRIYRTKYSWTVLLELNQKYTQKKDCSATNIRSTATKDCYGLSEAQSRKTTLHKWSENN